MNENLKLSSIKSIYFIGIGGIGMSALARHFNSKDIHVEGYDRVETNLTRKLVDEGIEVHYKDDPELIPKEADLVIYTPAIPSDHSQLIFWKESKKPILKRSQALGLLTQGHKTIAIAGTHGKTTTSALMTHCLKYLGIDVSAFVGGIMKNYQSNYLTGGSEWMIVEADEFDRSFLQLNPDVAVLISVDADHLDIYGDHQEMQKGFIQFLNQVKQGGQIIVHEAVAEILGKEEMQRLESKVNVTYYSDVLNEDLSVEISSNGNSFFIGTHNIENAIAVVKVAESISDCKDDIMNSLGSFEGIKRRFDKVYESKNYLFVDDYAHHPTAISSVIQAMKKLADGRKILGIFQPHLYSRTKDFYDDFAKSLSELDSIILLDIYPAREEPIPGVSADMIFEKIDLNSKWRSTKHELIHDLKDKIEPVILTMGAGDIDTLVEPIKNLIEKIDE